jgi:DGQHR domain-containing protein
MSDDGSLEKSQPSEAKAAKTEVASKAKGKIGSKGTKNKIKKKTTKNTKTPAQKAQEKTIREIFDGCGFRSVTELREREFEFDGAKCDFDDVFVCENVVILTEYTTTRAEVNKHLKNKSVVFDKIHSNPIGFVEFMKASFKAFLDVFGDSYPASLTEVRILYCPRYTLEEGIKELIPYVWYLEYPTARYFQNLVRTVKKSARYELLEFLSVSYTKFAENIFAGASGFTEHRGSILPEEFSNFGKGFKVVTFYVQPEVLLARSYVLRRGSWRSSSAAYQRMISRPKIDAVRRYLTTERRAFINNIIVTLPPKTRLVNESGHTVDPANIHTTEPGIVKIPEEFNVIGLIDGQHRVYSYYEGGPQEEKVAGLRKQLNLLVTGVIFPEEISEADKSKFEANLFLEINSNQTNPRSNLKHEINVLLRPFLAESVARLVLNALNENKGALQDWFERYFYDQDKLKNTSIVLYGLKPLVSLNGEFPLFNVWQHPKRDDLKSEAEPSLLAEYVEFCGHEINKVFSAVRQILPDERWDTDKKKPGSFLTTVNVNGVLLLIRRLAREGMLGDRSYYLNKLVGIEKFPFHNYGSNLYAQMADKMFLTYFASSPA